jgi:hypothetical protein
MRPEPPVQALLSALQTSVGGQVLSLVASADSTVSISRVCMCMGSGVLLAPLWLSVHVTLLFSDVLHPCLHRP